jgi:hypothetical protein
LCVAVERSFEELLPAADVLGAYAVRVRYPLEGADEPRTAEATEAIELAERVLTIVRSALR